MTNSGIKHATERIRDTLTEWHETMVAFEAQMSDLSDLFGGPVAESNFGDPMYHLAGRYTELVAEKVGCSYDVLEDWWCECGLGKQRMVFVDPPRVISAIDDLAEFIADLKSDEAEE